MHPLIFALALAAQAQDTSRAPRDTVRAMQQLPPIVVTVTRSPLDPMESPLPAATMSQEDIRRNERYSVARVVSSTPGVHALTTGEQIGKPVIRGLSGARVLVLEDGHRLEDYSWSDEDGPSLDPSMAHRIEIIRGPASLLYGSDAIGGVLNAVPEALPQAAAGQSLLRWRSSLGASTNNPGVGLGLGAEYARGSFGSRIQLYGRKAGSIQTPDGEVDNTGFGAFSGELALGVHRDENVLSLRYSHMSGEFKLLEANGPPVPPPPGGEEGPERKLNDNRVQLEAQTRWRGLLLELKSQVQSHNIIEMSDDATQPGVETETFNLLLNTATMDMLAHHRIGRSEGTFGVTAVFSSNDSRGLVPLVPDASSKGGAIFLIERFPLGRSVSLLAGVRGDALHLDADSNATLALGAQTRDFTAFSGDLGLVAQVAPGVALAVNGGRAYRAPNLFELFSNGVRLGEARYEIGDATLEPEVGFNVDASLRWQKSRVRGEIAVYRNHIDHFIFITPTSQFFDTTRPGGPPDSVRVFQYGQADATLMGGEASLAFDATPMLTLGIRLDALRGDNDSLDQPLPLIPPPRSVFEAELHARPGAAHRWYAGFEINGNAEQTRLAQYNIPGQGLQAADVATAGYVLFGLDGGFVTHLGSRRLTIDAQVRNIADTAYRDYLNRYKEFALDAGRSFTVRVGTEF